MIHQAGTVEKPDSLMEERSGRCESARKLIQDRLVFLSRREEPTKLVGFEAVEQESAEMCLRRHAWFEDEPIPEAPAEPGGLVATEGCFGGTAIARTV